MNQALSYVFARWESMRGSPYDNGPGRMEPPGVDCSGSVHWANLPVLDLPTTSYTVAIWGSNVGLIKSPKDARPGDLLLWGRDGNPIHGTGNNGHIGQMSDQPGWEWESTGPGVNLYRFGSRCPWQWAVDMSPWYGRGVATAVTPPEEEEFLATLSDAEKAIVLDQWSETLRLAQQNRDAVAKLDARIDTLEDTLVNAPFSVTKVAQDLWRRAVKAKFGDGA